MLRLLTQSHNILMSPLILSFVSKSNTPDILRSYFLPPSTLNRQFHIFTGDLTKTDECKMMATKKGKKDERSKSSKTKKKSDEVCEEAELEALEHGGSCPPRLTPRCCVTLRPEDATAAACAAKVAEAAARRAALASKKPKPRRKAKKPSEPVVRERLCMTPGMKQPKFRECIEPIPKEERMMPQSTKPWVHSRYEDISRRMEKSPIAAAYRPVAKPIRVCTPQEVRKIFAPKVEPCKPCSGRTRFRQRVSRLIVFASKVVIAACVIMLTIDLGIWDSSDSAADIFSTLIFGSKDNLPHLEYLGYSIKETWNCGIRTIFYIIGKLIPSMADRVHLGSSETEAEKYLVESTGQLQ